MRLTARDQPSFIGVDEKIDTIGVTTALVAIDAPPDSPRASRLRAACESAVRKIRPFLRASNNLNWKGSIGGANCRLAALWRHSGWLNENKGAPNAALETFRTMAQTAAPQARAKRRRRDRLYESLMHERDGQLMGGLKCPT